MKTWNVTKWVGLVMVALPLMMLIYIMILLLQNIVIVVLILSIAIGMAGLICNGLRLIYENRDGE